MNETVRPTLPLAMPHGPNFSKTVVLRCDFLPEGAFGIVLNRPTDMPASRMVRLEPEIVGGNALLLCVGGPVEPDRGWILTADRPIEPEYREIVDGLYLSTSPMLLRRVLETR